GEAPRRTRPDLSALLRDGTAAARPRRGAGCGRGARGRGGPRGSGSRGAHPRVKPQGILFDAGGTLIHVDGERVCRAAGVDVDRAAFSSAARAAADDIGVWTARNPNSTDAERLPVYLDAMLHRLGIEDADHKRRAARAIALEHARSNLWSHAEPG